MAQQRASGREAALEFAEYVVLNARRLWEEFPLELRRRMQQVLFPEDLVWSGEAFRAPVTCLFFRDSERPQIGLEKVVAHSPASWNRIQVWLVGLNHLRESLDA